MIWSKLIQLKTNKEFSTYIDKHKHDIYQISHLLVGDPSVAERISIEVFLQAYHHPDKLKAPIWLYRTVVHLAIEYLEREEMKRNEVENDHFSSVNHHALTPLETALRSLSIRDRTTIILRHICSLKTENVQEILDKTHTDLIT